MIGRSAQGNPWIFQQIGHFLKTGEKLAPPSWGEIRQVVLAHLASLHIFYSPPEFCGRYPDLAHALDLEQRPARDTKNLGVRIARKHFHWYLDTLSTLGCSGTETFRKYFNQLETASAQLAGAEECLAHLIKGEVMAA
jgi:tRNA-dihydrouridine synthase B